MTLFLWSLVAGAAAQLASQSDIEIRSMPQWNCPHSTITGGNTSCIAAVSSIQTFDFELVGLSQVYHSVQLWVAGAGGVLTQLTIGSINPTGALPFDKERYYFRIPPNLHTGMSKLSITVVMSHDGASFNAGTSTDTKTAAANSTEEPKFLKK